MNCEIMLDGDVVVVMRFSVLDFVADDFVRAEGKGSQSIIC